ncbi:MAG: hypothetical protein PUB98_02665 [Clostridiales bacterium]|nr:hypothetical protein [Clostridiales bacterium]
MTYDQRKSMDKYAQYIMQNRYNINVLEVGYGLGVFAEAIEK